MITTHQYLDKYPIDTASEKLIIGTIHPHDHEAFKVPFFYGNRLSLWEILDQAFDNEIGTPITLKGILSFLQEHKIGVSDTIRECTRTTPFALDSDLIPTKLNHEIVNQIENSNITEIFFTSGFQKNNAFKLFYVDILGQWLTAELRNNRERILGCEIFGRPVKLTILYSPAGTANIGLSKSSLYHKDKLKYIQSKAPVQDFKVDYYRSKFKKNS